MSKKSMLRSMSRSVLRPLPMASIVASGVAFLLLSQCKPAQTFSEAEIKDVGSDAVPNQGLKIKSFKLVPGNGGRFEVKLPNSGRDFKAGDTAKVKYGVVQKRSGDPYACGALEGSATVKLKDEGKFLTFPVKLANDAFSTCSASDGVRKLSLECQKSGDWEGTKVLEICLSSQDGSTQVFGRTAPGKDGGAFSLAEGQLAHIDDIINYGKVCAQRLGPLPRDWSCLDGEVIPITKDGEEIPFDQHQRDQKCDKPAYLGLGGQGQCVPYSRLGRLQTGPNVETVFICRRYNIFKADGSRYGIDEPFFQDVAIVQHNVKTGESCYFQALSGFRGDKDLPAARIPPPDEEVVPDDIKNKYTKKTLADGSPNPDYVDPQYWPEPSRGFWIRPSDPNPSGTPGRGFECTNCHDSDAYMHSPYVDQLNYTYPEGHPLAGRTDKMVPCNPGDPNKLSDPQCILTKKGMATGKVSLVHKVHARWKKQFHIAPKNDDTCTKCHRIGSTAACGRWVEDSVGGETIMAEYRTEWGLTYPESHWMPISDDFWKSWTDRNCKPNVADESSPVGCNQTKEQWEASFADSAKKVVNCCRLYRRGVQAEAQFNASCVAEPITEPAPPSGGREAITLTASTLPVEVKDFDQQGNESGVTQVVLGPEINGTGEVKHVQVAMQLDHGSHTNLRVLLKHKGRVAVVYDGQKEGFPGASGELNISFNSADNFDRFRNLMGVSPGDGDWTLEIEDRKMFETGALTNAEVTVSWD